jgi:hypothetical protein
MAKILEDFTTQFMFFSIVLLVFLLQDTIEMVTGVTKTCRCKKQKTKYIQLNNIIKLALLGLCMNDKDTMEFIFMDRFQNVY